MHTPSLPACPVRALVIIKLFTTPDGQPAHLVEVVENDADPKASPSPADLLRQAITALEERLARRIW